MITSTILSIDYFHQLIVSNGGLWANQEVRPNMASQERRLTNILNVVLLVQLLQYSSRCVAVAFAYAENAGKAGERADPHRLHQHNWCGMAHQGTGLGKEEQAPTVRQDHLIF